MRTSFIATFSFAILFFLADGRAVPGDRTVDEQIKDETQLLEEFDQRLQRYVAARYRLDAPLPPLVTSEDAAAIRAVVAAHTYALRNERHLAKQGDIFFEEITKTFRRRIHEALRGADPGEYLARTKEDDAPQQPAPVVNAVYPGDGALQTMPSEVLRLLPPLPEGLEYRFIERDLILWDPHAVLIIDFIPNAVY
ncbi:MAG: hypothetical protein ACRD1W_17010 [Vicinamibacterales bacterium]